MKYIIIEDVKVLKVTEARVLIHDKAYGQPMYNIPITRKLNLTGYSKNISIV